MCYLRKLFLSRNFFVVFLNKVLSLGILKKIHEICIKYAEYAKNGRNMYFWSKMVKMCICKWKYVFCIKSGLPTSTFTIVHYLLKILMRAFVVNETKVPFQNALLIDIYLHWRFVYHLSSALTRALFLAQPSSFYRQAIEFRNRLTFYFI